MHLARFLSPEALSHFQQLHAFDRSHLIAVANDLVEQGAGDDLAMAGLLHDIGKADHASPIRLADRVVYAIIPTSFSRLMARVRPVQIALPGLPVLVAHAETGATWLEDWDYPHRVAWLVRNHENREVHDLELTALIDADSRC